MSERSYWKRGYSRRTVLAGSGVLAFAAACSGSNTNSNTSTTTSKPSTVASAVSGAANGAASPTRAAASPAAPVGTPVAVQAAAAGAGAVYSGVVKPLPLPDAPKMGGVSVIGQQDPAITMDPHTTESPMSHNVQGAVYSSLMRTLEDTPGLMYLVEDLAASVQQPDQLTYVYKLQPGITWHNVAPVNGRAFTSDDVKYSLQRLASDNPEVRLHDLFSVIDQIQTPDPQTVVVKTKFPYAPFLLMTAFEWSQMVPHEVVDAGKIDTLGIGTGPYVLQGDFAGTKDSELVLKKNPNYYKKGLPYIDTLKFQIVPDLATLFAKALSGDVDTVSFTTTSGANVLKQQQDQYKSKFPNATFYELPAYGSWYKFYFNLNGNTPFAKDKRVRQAAVASVDYAKLGALFSNVGAQAAPMAPGNKAWAYDPAKLPKFDLQKAQQLMSAAGFADGFKITDSVAPTFGGTILAPVVKQFFSALKIDVTIDTQEPAAWIANVYRGVTYEMSSHADASWDDPDKNLYSRYHSTGATNNTHIKEPALDQMLDAQRREFDYTKRKAIVDDIQAFLLDYAGECWMYSSGGLQASAPWLKNYRAMVGGNWNFYHARDIVYLDGAPNRT